MAMLAALMIMEAVSNLEAETITEEELLLRPRLRLQLHHNSNPLSSNSSRLQRLSQQPMAASLQSRPIHKRTQQEERKPSPSKALKFKLEALFIPPKPCLPLRPQLASATLLPSFLALETASSLS